MLLFAIVFLGVFAVAAVVLLLLVGGGKSTSKSEATFAALKSSQAPGPGQVLHEAKILDFRKNVMLSAVPWFNDLLQKFELAPRLRILLFQANLKWTTGQLILMCGACFLASALLVYWRTELFIAALGAGLVISFLPLGFVFFMRGRRFAKFEQLLPEALDLMVSALRAGHSLNAALGLVSRECEEPIRGEFQVCFAEQNFGLELSTALENLTVRVPLQDLRIATTAILIQKETGGNLAEVLNKTSEVIRERFRLKRQIKVHTAHGRMTGGVISFLPLALLLILYLVNPAMESILWKREIGKILLYTAGGMMVVGGLIIRKIINMEV
jgi:tight adherence protein B